MVWIKVAPRKEAKDKNIQKRKVASRGRKQPISAKWDTSDDLFFVQLQSGKPILNEHVLYFDPLCSFSSKRFLESQCPLLISAHLLRDVSVYYPGVA
jgi:hypothetical protein